MLTWISPVARDTLDMCCMGRPLGYVEMIWGKSDYQLRTLSAKQINYRFLQKVALARGVWAELPTGCPFFERWVATLNMESNSEIAPSMVSQVPNMIETWGPCPCNAGEAKDKAEEELKDMRPLKTFDFYPTAMLLPRRVAIFWTIQHC